MRPLLFLPRLETGGAERQFIALAEGLRRAEHAPLVVTLWPGGGLEGALDRGVERTTLLDRPARKAARGLRLAGAPRALRALVERVRPDVVYSGLYVADALAHRGLRGTGVPLVWGLRSAAQRLGPVRGLAYRYCRRHAASVPLAISNSWTAHAHHEADGFRFRRHVVVPNGIDVAAFRRDPEAGLELRRRWNVPADAHLIGLVGRLRDVKDPETFLRTAALLHGERCAGARERFFVLVGPGAPEEVQGLTAKAKTLGIAERVRFPGASRDVAAVYSALDLLLLTSRSESLPNVLCEALACGTPCVATRVGDAARVLGPDARTAAVGDAEGLARLSAEVLAQDPAERLAKAERERARIASEYGLERLVSDTLALLETVAAQPARA